MQQLDHQDFPLQADVGTAGEAAGSAGFSCIQATAYGTIDELSRVGVYFLHHWNPMPEKELAVGKNAPDFSLADQAGKPVRLSDFRGKQAVVLIFYPGDMTPGCTLQLCAIRDDWQKFREAGIAVFGVNHADAASHARFAGKYRFPFPLLVDEGKAVSKKYGAMKKLFKANVIKRSVIGIGKDGVVRYVRRGMPRDAEILKAMTAEAGIKKQEASIKEEVRKP
jgi:peroxiredoxin Q/BCP